tara:strand:+ start:4534 stop:4917 length:384 start_codon:yes stop_codon:yes gene_type:complete
VAVTPEAVRDVLVDVTVRVNGVGGDDPDLANEDPDFAPGTVLDRDGDILLGEAKGEDVRLDGFADDEGFGKLHGLVVVGGSGDLVTGKIFDYLPGPVKGFAGKIQYIFEEGELSAPSPPLNRADQSS